MSSTRTHQLQFVVFALILIFVGASSMSAQSFRGGIEGVITDPNGAVLPGADVKVSSPDTGLTRTATTNDIGYYIVNELPVGMYTVAVSKSGFKGETIKGVAVAVSNTTRADAKLNTGSTSEVVNVTADVPLIESTTNTLGGTIDELQLKELPVNGRDFTKTLVMVPGSTGDPAGGSDSPGSFGLFSSNGNRGRSNNYLLDGIDMNDGYRNLPILNQGGVFGTPSTVLPVDALAEIPVISNTEAEYGRNSGAVVNIVTKSGTNTWHGSGYEFFRNNALDARNYFNDSSQPQAPFHNNQYGASLGGPIVKDKSFFFFAWEGQRESGKQPVTLKLPAAGDLVGASNPIIANIIALNPWGPLPAGTNGGLPVSVQQLNPFTNSADTFILKYDQHFGSDVLTARYLLGTSDQSFPLALVGSGGTPGYNTLTPTKVHQLSGSFTHIFSSHLVTEIRGGYNEFTEIFVPQDRAFDPASIGLNTGVGTLDFGLPTISISSANGSFSGIGATRGDPRGRTDRNYQFFTNTSWNHGRHDWKFGFEYRRTTVDQFFDSGHRGSLSFPDLASFLSGSPNSSFEGQAIGDSLRNTYQNNTAFYVQDSWKIHPRFTINAGLRWDYFGVIGEKNNLFSLFDPAGNSGMGAVNNVKQLYPKDYNNFGPRVSLAWDVFGSGKTVARAGWGLYYDAFSQDFFAGQLPWPTFNAGVAFDDAGPKAIQFFIGSPTLTPVACSPTNIAIPNSGGQCADPVYPSSGFGGTSAFTVDKRLRTPYIQNFNLNVEQQLAKHVALQVGYVGSRGRKLFTYNDINQIQPGTGTIPFPNFFYILQFASASDSQYDSLQSSLKLRNWRGLTSTVNWTYSHSIDTASDGQDYVPNATQPDNSYCRSCERANSNFDQRHHFVWTYHYDFPHANTMKPLLNGWGLDGVVTLNTGQPVNVSYLFEGDFNGTGEFYGRPDLIGDPYAGTNGTSRYLNLDAFAAPCTWDPLTNGCVAGTQHIGSLGRNAIKGPNYRNMDFSIVKDTKLGEKLNMQLRADFFNLLNHPNFANPMLPSFAVDFAGNGISCTCNGDATNGHGLGLLQNNATPDVAFGNPFLGGGGARNIQLAVRFSF